MWRVGDLGGRMDGDGLMGVEKVVYCVDADAVLVIVV